LNLVKQFIKKKSVVTRADEDRYFGSSYGKIFGPTTFYDSKSFLNAYQFISYVGNAAGIISSDIASLDWKIIEKTGKSEKEVDNPEINKLIENPLEGSDTYEFSKYCMLHSLLDGNIFVVPQTTNLLAEIKGTFNELIPLNSSLVDIYDQEGAIVRAQDHTSLVKVSKYKITFGSSVVYLPPEAVLHSKITNPMNLIRGMGHVQKNANTLDADKFISLFNKAFFNGGVKSNLILSQEKGMGPTEYSRLKAQIKDEMTGWENFDKPLITPPGVSATPVKLTYDEIQFIEQKKFTRTDVYSSLFNIPSVRTTLMDDANYNTAKPQLKMYYESTIPSYYKPLETLYTKCIQLKTGKNYFFKFIPKTITDPAENAKTGAQAFDRGALTPRAYAKMIGQPTEDKNPALDKYYIPMKYVPIEEASFSTDITKEEGGKAIDVDFSVVQSDEKAKKANRKQWRIHFAGAKNRKTLTPKTYKEVKEYYIGFEKRAIANFDRLAKKDIFQSSNFIEIAAEIKKVTGDNIIDWEAEKVLAKNSAKKFHTSIIVKGLKEFNDILDTDIDTTFKNQKIKLTVDKLGIKYANETIDSRKKELTAILEKAVAEGVPISETKGRIQDYFKTLNAADPKKGWRTDRIARTEVSTAYDQSSKISYEEIDTKQIQVIGCEKKWEGWDCDDDGSRAIYPMSQFDDLSFHPNHGGSIVPVFKD
jgi:HK97 family phage portal protein